MLGPRDVRSVVADAARLARQGELIVFGSASLAFWLDSAPPTRDVDLYCLLPERGDPIEALMGELSWYHERGEKEGRDRVARFRHWADWLRGVIREAEH